jgi:hypothetical protein
MHQYRQGFGHMPICNRSIPRRHPNAMRLKQHPRM